MAHTDRQPSDEIFKDIQEAAVRVWVNGNYHRDYEEEKLNNIWSTENYADNWNSIYGAFDGNNRMIFFHHIRRQDTVDFLKKMQGHYRIFIPRDKI